MLYIETSDGKCIKEWHVGEKIRWNTGLNPDTIKNSVAEVQADGDELEWIKENIQGIPQSPLLRVARWFGDDAKFIANCLPVQY